MHEGRKEGRKEGKAVKLHCGESRKATRGIVQRATISKSGIIFGNLGGQSAQGDLSLSLSQKEAQQRKGILHGDLLSMIRYLSR